MPSRRSLPAKKSRSLYKNAVGSAVRRLRNERELTQEDFAAQLQVLGWTRCTRGWLSRIEARLVAVRDYELTYLSKVLEVPLEMLFPSLDPSEVDPGFEAHRLNDAPLD